jgi:hypothetical protein
MRERRVVLCCAEDVCRQIPYLLLVCLEYRESNGFYNEKSCVNFVRLDSDLKMCELSYMFHL